MSLVLLHCSRSAMLASVPLRCCRRGVASRREIELDAAYEGQAEQTVTANEQQHHRRNVNDRSAAAFLLQEAEREAADEQAAIEAQRASQERILQRTRASGQVTDQTTEMQPAWDGEETQERMIRRILEDQYKPLRIKGYQKKLPEIAPLPNRLFDDQDGDISTDATPAAHSSSTSTAAPLEPWQYTYKAPENYQPPPVSVHPRKPPSPLSASSRPVHRVDQVSKKSSSATDRRATTRHSRLADAWERSLDYGAGFRPSRAVMIPVDENGEVLEDGGETHMTRRALGGMRAWEGIVEDKILQAQKDGLFKNVKGRGKPLLRDLEAEANPFIPRDDFLINRIIKSQGVAPPWIELQQELETALGAFRTSLRDAWIRRACRMQSLDGLTRASIIAVEEGWRDKEWERSQRSYHEASIYSVNQIVRRYNIQAPFPVRRGLLSLSLELDAAIKACKPAIVWELERRLQGGRVDPLHSKSPAERERAGTLAAEEQRKQTDRFWPALRRAVFEMFGVGQVPEQVTSSREEARK